MPYKDKETRRKHDQNNREKINAWQRTWGKSHRHLRTASEGRARAKRYRAVHEYLKTHPCVDCGETRIPALQFDHVADKSYGISRMILMHKSIESIFEEICKCEVRCANCHAMKTATDQKWYKWVY
jgi:hypothetical protein